MPQAVYFVRYAHEMNGVWFPWAQQPSAYRASFAAVAGWFRAASCGAMMLWAPNWRACVSTNLVDKHIIFLAALCASGTVFSNKMPVFTCCFWVEGVAMPRQRRPGRLLQGA